MFPLYYISKSLATVKGFLCQAVNKILYKYKYIVFQIPGGFNITPQYSPFSSSRLASRCLLGVASSLFWLFSTTSIDISVGSWANVFNSKQNKDKFPSSLAGLQFCRETGVPLYACMWPVIARLLLFSGIVERNKHASVYKNRLPLRRQLVN